MKERIGRLVEERFLPRIGRLIPMELHAELLRKCKAHGGPRKGKADADEG